MKRRYFIKFTSLVVLLPIFGARRLMGQLNPTQELLAEISPNFHFPGERTFLKLKQIFNRTLKPKDPLSILRAHSYNEIQKAFKACSTSSVNVRMRCGGHSFEGFSMGDGLVVDVRQFKHVIVESDRVRLGSGLQLNEVQSALDEYDLTFPTGSCPTVGISGFLLGGGHSLKSRYWGLAADCVQSMKVILANGKRAIVSPNENSELYWALLGGGGGNFALVEEFSVDRIISRKEMAFDFLFPTEKAAEVFEFWEESADICPDYMSVVFMVNFFRGKVQNVRIRGIFNDLSSELNDDSKLDELFKQSLWSKLEEFGPVFKSIKIRSANYVRDETDRAGFKGSSHYAVEKIGKSGMSELLKLGREMTRESNLSLIFEPFGGKIAKPVRSNSYPHRNARYIVELYTGFFHSQRRQRTEDFNKFFKASEHLFSGKCYINYPDLNLSQDWANRYYGNFLPGLLKVKRRYDPDNLFDFGSHSLSKMM